MSVEILEEKTQAEREFEENCGYTLHQRDQLAKIHDAGIGLFTGGPGVGKTHSITQYIKNFVSINRGKRVQMVAPTGKAAQRMSEMAAKISLPIRGTTIHTALGPQRNGHDGGGWGFFHGENNPLFCDLLIVDESSMIDASLMANLLAAIKPGIKAIFVGDPHQLPPVGRGRPFADMIAAGLPHGHLTEIHRFAGRIARVCKQIVDGEHWTPSPRIDLEAADFPENLRHIECSTEKVVGSLKETILALKGNRGFDPFEDVQVMCATNDMRNNLNGHLQKLLNPNGETIEGNPFRIGDKAICTRNQWVDQDWEGRFKPREQEQRYVANGEIGIVRKIDKAFTAIDFGDKTLRFAKGLWVDISLAYAVTVWKAQGSQWPVAITIAEDNRGADMITDYSFWNTGFSRGGQLSFSIGRRSAIDRQCSKRGLNQRKTLLKEKILKWRDPDSEFEPQEQEAEPCVASAWDDFSDI